MMVTVEGQCSICKGPLQVPVRQAWTDSFRHRDREVCSYNLNRRHLVERVGIDLDAEIAEQRRIGLLGIANHASQVRSELGLPAS